MHPPPHILLRPSTNSCAPILRLFFSHCLLQSIQENSGACPPLHMWFWMLCPGLLLHGAAQHRFAMEARRMRTRSEEHRAH